MVAPQSPDGSIQDQAVRWITRLNSGEATHSERRAFETWLAADENHRLAYEEAQRFWDGLEGLKAATFPEMDAARNYRPGRISRRAGFMAAAAALVVLAGGIWVLAPSVTGDTYRTAKGEQKTIVLADGTRVEMNTDSELTVALDRDSRTVTMHRGEAVFTIAHNGDSRPFNVVAGRGRVRDLGTEFGVHTRRDSASVVVLEGLVEIAAGGSPPQRLSAGERVAVNSTGQLSAVERVDAEAATAWRSGRFVFKGVPLSEMVDQIARYHAIAIEIKDPHLGQLAVSGTFRIHDVDGLLAAIEATLPVKVNRLPGGVVHVNAIEPPADS
jgi:transmembrane sensor